MDGSKKYILIGEDDKFFAKVYSLKLSKAGYNVVIVENGKQVIAQAMQKKPDLIILDLIMPIKDGFQTLQELKANVYLQNIKVIVTSGLEQSEDVQKVKQLGAVGFFNKSSIQNIVTEIQKLLK